MKRVMKYETMCTVWLARKKFICAKGNSVTRVPERNAGTVAAGES
jgi:hypothetical protein